MLWQEHSSGRAMTPRGKPGETAAQAGQQRGRAADAVVGARSVTSRHMRDVKVRASNESLLKVKPGTPMYSRREEPPI